MANPLNIGHKLMTQKEARQRGEKFYYTGLPCREGHYALRYASSSNCIECRTWGNRSKLGREAHRNVHWFTMPVAFSAFDYPNALEWTEIQKMLLDLVPDVWQAYKNRVGPPEIPREKWPADLRMCVIEGHLCYFNGNDKPKANGGVDTDMWMPMYMQGVERDPRHPIGVFDRMGFPVDFTGIFWREDLQQWMVSNLWRDECMPFMRTPKQMLDAPVNVK